MGFFQGLGKAFKGMDMQKLSNGIGMARAHLEDDPDQRQRLFAQMMQQRQQQQPQQQPQQQAQPGFGAVLPSHAWNPQGTPAYQPQGFGAVRPSDRLMPSQEEIEMMRQGRSRGWHGGYNPPWAMSLGSRGIY